MINIRLCEPSEVATLKQIADETFIDTFADFNTAKDMEKFLNNDYHIDRLLAELVANDSWTYFMLQDQHIVGYMKLNINSSQTEEFGTDTLEVQRIYIRKPFKRQGLGKQLLEHADHEAKKLGKQKVVLGVWEHNLSAIAFYKKLGFKEIGSHDFWLGDDKQTDYIMMREVV